MRYAPPIVHCRACSCLSRWCERDCLVQAMKHVESRYQSCALYRSRGEGQARGWKTDSEPCRALFTQGPRVDMLYLFSASFIIPSATIEADASLPASSLHSLEVRSMEAEKELRATPSPPLLCFLSLPRKRST